MLLSPLQVLAAIGLLRLWVSTAACLLCLQILVVVAFLQLLPFRLRFQPVEEKLNRLGLVFDRLRNKFNWLTTS